jgi:hypothetical protein
MSWVWAIWNRLTGGSGVDTVVYQLEWPIETAIQEPLETVINQPSLTCSIASGRLACTVNQAAVRASIQATIATRIP